MVRLQDESNVGEVHYTENHTVQEKTARPKRRKSLGDILGNITDKVTSRRNTLPQCSPTPLGTSPPQPPLEAVPDHCAAASPNTNIRMYGADGPMPLAVGEGNAASFEDINDFEARLEELVNSTYTRYGEI